jgi:hypothetical protein
VSLSAVLLAAASPSPSPSPSGTAVTVPSLQDAQESATNAASWVEQNWSTWLAIGLRVLLIVVIAAVLRMTVRRAITKLIDRMNRTVESVDGTALGGLLVNAERRRQRSQAIGSVLRSVASFVILGTAALMVLAPSRSTSPRCSPPPVSRAWRSVSAPATSSRTSSPASS